MFNNVHNLPEGESFTSSTGTLSSTHVLSPGEYNVMVIFQLMRNLAKKSIKKINLAVYEPAEKTRMEIKRGSSIAFSLKLQKILGSRVLNT